MYGSAVFEVAAEAHGEVGESAFFAVDGEKVGESLCGMAVTSVSGVYNGNRRVYCRHIRCSLERMAHCDDIGVAGDDLCGVRHALAL